MAVPINRGIAFLLLILGLWVLVGETERDAAKEKLQYMRELYSSSHVIDFTDARAFKRYLINGPRDYSVILFIGSDTKDIIKPNFERVARTRRAMVSNVSDTDLFFAYADIVGLKSIFKEFNGKVTQIPTLIHIPPTKKSGSQFYFADADKFDFSEEFSAHAMAKWVTSRTKVDIPIFDFPWHYVAIGFGGLVALSIALQMIVRLIKSWKDPFAIWLGACLIYYAMVAGLPYVLINNPPAFVADFFTGQILWYMPRQRGQFKFEGLVVSVLAGFLTGTWVLLVTWLPKLQSLWKRRLMFIVLAAVFFGAAYGVYSMFTIKNPYYPGLLPKIWDMNALL